MAERCGVKPTTVMGHIERMADQDTALVLEHLRPEGSRLAEIRKGFEVCGGSALKPVKANLGEEFTYDEIRLARIFLRREGTIPEW